MNVYQKGDLIRCSAAFTDSAGAAVDPTVVIFSHKLPDATIVTYTYNGPDPADANLKRSGAGGYYADVDGAETGHYYYRFHSTGTGQGAAEGDFRVSVSDF